MSEEKSEYTKQMESVIKAIELQVAEKLSKDIVPQAVLGTHRTFEMLFEFYCGGQPDWKIAVFFALDADGETAMRVLRTMDLPTGEILVL